MSDPPLALPRIDNTTFLANADHYTLGRGPFDRPTLIVLHNTETQSFGNAPSGAWLARLSYPPVSIHHLYGRDGTRFDIVRRVNTAWHVGEAEWGIYTLLTHEHPGGILNQLSIGHELESSSTAADAGNGYTAAQIAALAYTVACEMISYQIPWGNVVRHADIAVPRGRRHDPSHFDWTEFRQQTDTWRAFLRAQPDESWPHWFI